MSRRWHLLRGMTGWMCAAPSAIMTDVYPCPTVKLGVMCGAWVILGATSGCEDASRDQKSSHSPPGVAPSNQSLPNIPPPAKDCKLAVYAASSLRDLVDAELSPFLRQHPGCAVEKSYGSSGKLAQQIEAGAKYDVFLSAARAPVDQVVAAGKGRADSRVALFSNRLVLVSHRGDPVQVTDGCGLLSAPFKHLVVGHPESVPAGIYAREYLSQLECPGVKRDPKSSVWAKMQDKLLPMPEVRAVLSVVEEQPGTLGFVYRTDVQNRANVTVKYVVEGPAAPKVTYWGVLGPHASAGARDFYQSFRSEVGREILARLGFIVGVT